MAGQPMKHVAARSLAAAALLAAAICISQASAGDAAEAGGLPPAGSRDVLLTDAWRFSKDDEPRAKEAAFDDSAWRTVDLPHDWSVEEPFDSKLASCTA